MSILYLEYLILILPLFVFLWISSCKLQVKIHTVVLIFLLLALSRPVLDKKAQDTKVQGRNVVIALDASYSMTATDVQPNRYAFAKEFIKEYLALNQNDNVMLFVFTTNPLLLSPPTTDHQLILTALDSLNLEYILTRGTSLVALFESLQKIDIKHKNLILISDGGEERELKPLVNAMRERAKSFNVVALGDSSGSTIMKEDGVLLKDKDGNLVISRVNPLLKQLAVAFNGTYVSVSSSLDGVANTVSKTIEAESQSFSKKQYQYTELYQIPLLIGAMLFLALHTKAIKYIVFALLLVSSYSQASILDDYQLYNAYESYTQKDYNQTLKYLEKVNDDTLEYRMMQAGTHYKLGEYEEAFHIYSTIQNRSVKIKKQLYFNMANCLAKQGRYSDARVFYAKVLQLGEDEEARGNLNIIALKKDEKQNKVKSIPQSQKKSAGKGEVKLKKEQSKEKSKLNEVKDVKQKYEISSKTYELINKGYIHENKPW